MIEVVKVEFAMLTKLDYSRFPRVQIWRRGVAFGIDFLLFGYSVHCWAADFLVSNLLK